MEKEKYDGKQKTPTESVSETLLAAAGAMLDGDSDDVAFSMYRTVVENDNNAEAQYNLGTLYATGKGTAQDLKEASYWYHQAALNGDEKAEKLCTKSMMDYMYQGLEDRSARELFQRMQEYAAYVHPRENIADFVATNLYDIGVVNFNKQEDKKAEKFFRAAAEFANDKDAQNGLALLYNLGRGVDKDDLTALYWFDRAADNHVEAALKDRDGTLAYYHSLGKKEFAEQIELLAKWCMKGTDKIPKDVEKAYYWREKMKEYLKN